MTFFVALIILDERRISSSRHDCLCCLKANSQVEGQRENPDNVVQQHQDGELRQSDPSASFVESMMRWYLKCLLHPLVKGVVILSFLSLYGFCAVRTADQQIDFNAMDLLPTDSYVRSFSTALNNFTQRRVSVNVYFRDVDQSSARVRDQMVAYVNDLFLSVDAISEPPRYLWVEEFDNFITENEDKLEGLPFNESLRSFLDDPRFQYNGSIILDNHGGVLASRTQIRFDNLDPANGIQAITAMKEQSKITLDQPINQGEERPAFFAYTESFNIWESAVKTEHALVSVV